MKLINVKFDRKRILINMMNNALNEQQDQIKKLNKSVQELEFIMQELKK